MDRQVITAQKFLVVRQGQTFSDQLQPSLGDIRRIRSPGCACQTVVESTNQPVPEVLLVSAQTQYRVLFLKYGPHV